MGINTVVVRRKKKIIYENCPERNEIEVITNLSKILEGDKVVCTFDDFYNEWTKHYETSTFMMNKFGIKSRYVVVKLLDICIDKLKNR